MALKELRPRKQLYGKLCRKLHITGISIFTSETFDAQNQIHTREFAPLYGYLEGPLCGMAGRAIFSFLNKKQPGLRSLQIEQGNFLKKPGIISIRKHHRSMWIGGSACIYKQKNI